MRLETSVTAEVRHSGERKQASPGTGEGGASQLFETVSYLRIVCCVVACLFDLAERLR